MRNNRTEGHLSSATSYSLVIGWLYPELMNIYGDRGNIICLTKRLEWRGIKAEVKHLDVGFDQKILTSCDLLIMGGAQDRQQTIVNEDLKKKKSALSEVIEKGISGLYVCGGFQFLGKYYKEADGTIIDGLGIFDLYTENPGENIKRLIGNIVVEPLFDILRVSNSESRSMFSTRRVPDGNPSSSNNKSIIIGFENHGGRTFLGSKVKPLGKVLKGFGNSEDGFEGARYKNSFGTYMHGPILPKNPHLADYLLYLALKKKYEDIELEDLDDSLEWQSHSAIAKRLQIEI